MSFQIKIIIIFFIKNTLKNFWKSSQVFKKIYWSWQPITGAVLYNTHYKKTDLKHLFFQQKKKRKNLLKIYFQKQLIKNPYFIQKKIKNGKNSQTVVICLDSCWPGRCSQRHWSHSLAGCISCRFLYMNCMQHAAYLGWKISHNSIF